MKQTITTKTGSTITIDDGYGITIDGGSAGSLEDAIKNFPQFAEDLWAAAHFEMKCAQDDCAHHRAELTELQTKHEALQASIVKPLPVSEPISEEDQIAAEVAKRVAAVRHEAEIQRRVAEAMQS